MRKPNVPSGKMKSQSKQLLMLPQNNKFARIHIEDPKLNTRPSLISEFETKMKRKDLKLCEQSNQY